MSFTNKITLRGKIIATFLLLTFMPLIATVGALSSLVISIWSTLLNLVNVWTDRI